MNYSNKIIIICILLLSLAGCAIPDPSKPTDSLLIGIISLESKGLMDFSSGTTVNGQHNSGIIITFENKQTQKDFRITSHSGLFYKVNPEPGEYFIKKLYFKKESNNNGWSEIWTMLNSNKTFKIESGKVTNLGFLKWNFTGQSIHYDNTYSNLYGADITVEKTSSQVKNLFMEKFPKSLWLNYDWIDVN